MSEQPQDPQSRRIPEARIAEFFRAACEYLKASGGVAKKSQVMDAIRPRLNLTPLELSLNASGQERWDAATAFGFIAFQKAGYLKRGGGTWRLLDAGRAAMESMTAMEMLDAAHEKYAEWDAAREEDEDDDGSTLEASPEAAGGRAIGVEPNAIPSCFLLNWNPSDFPWVELERDAIAIAGGGTPTSELGGQRWSVVTKQIRAGDRLFLVRLGQEPKGIVGSAVATSQPYAGPHWDAKSAKTKLYVDLRWDALLPPGQPPLSLENLRRRVSPTFNWTPQGSGQRIPADVARKLETTWQSRFAGMLETDDSHEAPPTLDSIAGEFFGQKFELQSVLHALETKRAVVLQGSPGTGKTFLAQKIAHHHAGSMERVHRVQFHPAYSYEDFVRGIRPTTRGFAVENGPLVRISDDARRAPREQFVLLIDELNRGNVAKILGEALSLIEVDKRDPKHRVKLGLAYEGSHDFWIPPNVAVLATMNTADRSIALVDYALRRRFAFIRLAPAYDKPVFFETILAQFAPGADEGASATERGRRVARTIVDAMRSINDLIIADKSFGEDFAIGHSFFCTFDPGRSEAVEAWATRVFEQEVRPLIDEYCVEHPVLRKKLLELIPTF